MSSLCIFVSVGSAFLTGETCPECLFESVVAQLIVVDATPSFIYFCGRCND